MRNTIILLFTLISAVLGAQSAIQFRQIYGTNGTEYGYSVKSCPDQGYILAGSTSSSNVTDGYLVRVDSLGLVMWSKTYGWENIDVIRSLRILPDSGYIMVGFTNSKGNGAYDGWLMRTNKNGDTLWNFFFGGNDWDLFYDVYPTFDSGFVMTGGTWSFGNGQEDLWVVKTDKNGQMLWSKTYGGNKQDQGRGVVETTDSLLAIAGFTYSRGDTLGDSWMLRMDQNGDTLWTRTIATFNNTYDEARSICQVYLDIVMCGVNATTTGDKDGFIYASDVNGNMIYNFPYGNPNSHDELNCIIPAKQGGMATTGRGSYIDPAGDFYFFHSGPWFATTYGTLEPDEAISIDNTQDSGYVMLGYTEGHNSFLPNMYLIKIDKNGVASNVLDIREPEENGSISIFPNPANEILMVRSESEPTFFAVLIDLNGKQIHSANTATSVMSIQVTSIPNGLYLLQLMNADGLLIGTKKVLIQH
jgi:hypothetical protein